MSKEKVKEIYGLIDTKEEAMGQYGLSVWNDESVAKFSIDNNQKNSLDRLNNA